MGLPPFVPTVVGCFVLVLIHRLLGRLAVSYGWVGWLVKGEKILLFSEGRENLGNMDKSYVSKKDMLEGVRMEVHSDSLEDVQEIYLERSGEISVIRRRQG